MQRTRINWVSWQAGVLVVLGFVWGFISCLCYWVPLRQGIRARDIPTHRYGAEQEEEAEVAAPRQWLKVVTFEGDIGRTTEPFMVGETWRLTWAVNHTECRTGNFIIRVLRPPDIYEGHAANALVYGQRASATTNFYSAGQFYLDIITGGPYIIVIEEYR